MIKYVENVLFSRKRDRDNVKNRNFLTSNNYLDLYVKEAVFALGLAELKYTGCTGCLKKCYVKYVTVSNSS